MSAALCHLRRCLERLSGYDKTNKGQEYLFFLPEKKCAYIS